MKSYSFKTNNFGVQLTLAHEGIGRYISMYCWPCSKSAGS